MDKQDVIGSGQIATGTYGLYQGIKHGLPRAVGIRIEYHTTSKANAELIKKAGYILNPEFGGKNGMSELVQSSRYIKNSKGFIHITGTNKDTVYYLLPSYIRKKGILPFYKTLYRKSQCLLYKFYGTCKLADIDKLTNSKTGKDMSKQMFKILKENILSFFSKTKCFAVPGIDSYFDNEFIPDVDDFALKSSKPIKAYKNRFSAMLGGLKKFGLKGIRENKARVFAGVSVLAISSMLAYKFIVKGIKNIKKESNMKNETSQADINIGQK